MAKGNNGNLLQHTIEVEVASWLSPASGTGELYLAITHGMKPFDTFEPRKNPSYVKLLDDWLSYSRTANPNVEPRIVGAYFSTSASSEHYPNTGELIAAALGERNVLSGIICEKEQAIADELLSVWYGTNVRVLQGSWREHLVELMAPPTLRTPWIFTMDPYGFTNSDGEDNGSVRECDFAFLSTVFNSYFRSQQRGAVTIFCYSMQPAPLQRLKQCVEDYITRKNVDVQPEYLTTLGKTGVQVAVVLSRDNDLNQHLRRVWQQIESRPPSNE